MSLHHTENILKNVCRVCILQLRETPTNNGQMESIFNRRNLENGSISIQELLQSVVYKLPKIDESDELPKLICSSCLEKLIMCDEFQQMCIQSDNILRNNLANYEDEEFKAFPDDISKNVPNKYPPIESQKKNEIVEDITIKGIEFQINQEEDSEFISITNRETLSTSICGETVYSLSDESSSKCESDSNDDDDDDETLDQSTMKKWQSEETDSATENDISEKMTCSVCMIIFASVKDLRKHTKRVHPEHYTTYLYRKMCIQSQDILRNGLVDYEDEDEESETFGYNISNEVINECPPIESQQNKNGIMEDITTEGRYLEINEIEDAEFISITNKQTISTSKCREEVYSLSDECTSESEGEKDSIDDDYDENLGEPLSNNISEKMTCSVCKIIFASVRSLRKHIKRVHPEHYTSYLNRKMCIQSQDILRNGLVNYEDEVLKAFPSGISNEVINEYPPIDITTEGKDLEINQIEDAEFISVINKETMPTSKCREEVYCISDESTIESQSERERNSIDDDNEVLVEPLSTYISEKMACLVCKLSFASMNSLRKHTKRVHPEHNTPYLNRHSEPEKEAMQATQTCDICDERLESLEELRQHKNDEHPDCNKVRCDEQSSINQAAHHPAVRKCARFKTNLNTHERSHSDERPYVCGDCGKGFKSGQGLRFHKCIYIGERPYKCGKCNSTFIQSAALKYHARLHSDENSHVQCGTCAKLFVSKESLKRHEQVHNGERPYVCGDCGTNFKTAMHLKIHKRIHTGEEPYKCEKCNSAFMELTALKQHAKVHSNEKPHFQCRTCGKCFNHKSRLKTHESNHLGEQSFVNGDCGKGLKNTTRLEAHKHKHKYSEEGSYECGKCESTFSQLEALNIHGKIHSDEKRPFQCRTCGRQFTRKDHLKRHEKIHTGQRPYVCEDCDKGFRTMAHLEVHQRRHTGERPYECDKCSCAFIQLAGLKNHARRHSGEKPLFQCRICLKRFSLKGTLKTHERIHTGERPYMCGDCGKYFKTIAHLEVHKRMHTGEKPYKCGKCNSAFTQLASLQRHTKVHPGEKLKKFECQTCGKQYTEKRSLKRHEKSHNGKGPFVCGDCGKSFESTLNLKIHKHIHTDQTAHECDK